MAATGAETSRSGATADSYIGSLISLTSKSEIRYEGILYNINTEESSIGLRNVKSFGTEGRKKDGPQISPFDKIYDYILFRGSDIKDLQVKSSPPVQPATQLHNDPAIIQSHYPRPSSTTTSIPSVASGTIPDISSHAGQVGIPRPFQNNLPLYQPGGIMGSWGSSTPTANGSGLGMPMYWQGFYAPTGGVPQHLQQPPLLRPPPGLPMHHSMQQPFQFPGINASLSSVQQSIPDSNAALSSGLLNLPGPGTQFPSGSSNMLELVPSLLPPISGPLSLSSTSLPSTVAHTQAAALAPQMLSNAMSNKPHTSLPVTTLAASLPSISNSASKLESISVSSKPAIPGSNIGYQAIPHPVSSTVGVSISSQEGTSLPSLVTPGQLFQTGPSTVSSSQSVQPAFKVDEIKTREPEDKDATSRPQKTSLTESNEPILPLPTPVERKPMGASVHNYHNNRGRGRGRGNVETNKKACKLIIKKDAEYPRAVTKFAEDFDFTAMNEKFKKDEVWGHLGKSKGHKEGYANEDYDDDNDVQDEEDAHSSKAEVKPVYVKDDFFDTLSCNTLDRENRNGRTKFSEQLKIDTETFGDFSRYRGSRGGRGFRGGRTRGSYYGRGYGYGGRGRGPSPSTRAM